MGAVVVVVVVVVIIVVVVVVVVVWHVPFSAHAKEAKNASKCTLSRLLMMTMTGLIFFLTLFNFLYAIAYLPTIQGPWIVQEFDHLSRAPRNRSPGIRSICQGLGPFVRD